MNLSPETLTALQKRRGDLAAQMDAFGGTPADNRILDDLDAKLTTGGVVATKPPQPGVDLP